MLFGKKKEDKKAAVCECTAENAPVLSEGVFYLIWQPTIIDFCSLPSLLFCTVEETAP